ncbi:DUF4148 domain-containing protein [Paraburkholderia humisilvae]|uniref:DUF4148 domain-containing protein n=1 Tax=Paraburkholderia humisilvae TaxID=627669 RepID=A0A6J5D9Q8_9BURK|nr:DUF4148 domain-containing protein [Paraburkholderia humisilvae]CAB3750101.1 hypothetical protein LMG29542_01196 [Paraburkholderia humisilvae]
MKASITTLTALLTLASSMAVHAQTNSEAPPKQQSAAPAQTSQWSATSPPNVEKTRAQVYAELVQAQRDGQIATLNRTVYAHH